MEAAAHSPSDGMPWTAAHGLREHLAGVASLAAQASDAFHAREWGHLAGLWHDVGKYRPGFQRYIRGEGPQTSHKLAGAALALEKGGLGRFLALTIAGHHGGIPAWSGGLKAPLRSKLDEARQELEEAVRAGAPPDILQQSVPSAPPWLTTLLRETKDPGDKATLRELFIRMVFSSLVDADFLDTEAYYSPAKKHARSGASRSHASIPELRRRLDAYLRRLSEEASPSTVNSRRAQVLAACRRAASESPGVFSLTVPTGGGKTLSAMTFALAHAERHGKRRVIVVVPFTSIIEQNAAVYSRIFGADHVLEHHSNWEPEERLQSEPHGTTQQHRHKLLCENWDAPIVVTTSVQFLESLHSNRPSKCRKLHNVSNSVIVLDEVQTLPLPLLDVTLQTLRCLSRAFRVSLVCCTATQPALGARKNADGYVKEGLGELREITTDSHDLYHDLKRVRTVWPDSLDHPVPWDRLATDVSQHKRVLTIVHKRADARELAALVPSAIHLSTLMLPSHRSRIIADIKRRLSSGDQSCRVVSTQLVEAGVDLDFPVVYRALAGLDSLAQSAGRCNREGRLAEGEFRVFVPPTSPPPGILERAEKLTRTMLRAGPLDLGNPDLYREFYARLYDMDDTDGKGIAALREDQDFPAIAQAYQVIDDQAQVSVVVPWRELDRLTCRAIRELESGFVTSETFRRVRRAMVTVPRRVAEAWLQQGVLRLAKHHPVPIVDLESWPRLYDERFGLDLFASPEVASEDLVL